VTRSLVRKIEVAPLRPGIYRARLGEEYDGIGQYVLVNLAGSSVGSAYKARVASGDFGGGRTIPVGTPVTVISYRGNLEVFLGNQPGCKIGGEDPFDRVIAQSHPGSFGTGPIGTWEHYDLGSTSFVLIGVDGDMGRVTRAGTSPASGRLSTSRLADSDQLAYGLPMEFLVEMKVDSGQNNGLNIYISNDNDPVNNLGQGTENIQLEIFPNDIGSGNADVNMQIDSTTFADNEHPFPDPAVGTVLGQNNWVRWRVEADQMRCKVWPSVSDEPEDWLVTFAYPEGSMDTVLAEPQLWIYLRLQCHLAGDTYIDSFKFCLGHLI